MSYTTFHTTTLPNAKGKGEESGGCRSEKDIVNSYFRDQGWDPSTVSQDDFLMLHWIRTAVKAGASRAEDCGLPILPSSPTSVVPSRRKNKVNADTLYILTPLLTSQRTQLYSIPEEDSVSTTSVESADQDQSSIEVSVEEFRNCCGMPVEEDDPDAIVLDWLLRAQKRKPNVHRERTLSPQSAAGITRSYERKSPGESSSPFPAIIARLRAKPKENDIVSTDFSQGRSQIQPSHTDERLIAGIVPSTDRETTVDNPVHENVVTRYAASDEQAANASLISRQSSDPYLQFVKDLEREFNLTHARHQLVLKELKGTSINRRRKPRLAINLRLLAPLVHGRLLRFFQKLRRVCWLFAKRELLLSQKWRVTAIVCLASLLLFFLLAVHHRSPTVVGNIDLRDDSHISESLECRLRIIAYETGV